MNARTTKPWRPLTPVEADKVAGNLGVYQPADQALYIGVDGSKPLFGLRGEIQGHVAAPPSDATQFRLEVNTSYRTRYRELSMAYIFDYNGALPPLQPAEKACGPGKPSPR